MSLLETLKLDDDEGPIEGAYKVGRTVVTGDPTQLNAMDDGSIAWGTRIWSGVMLGLGFLAGRFLLRR